VRSCISSTLRRAPSPVPARFTGAFSDRVENGSLVVEAGIQVERPGRYLIDCNLYDADDRPVAWTRYKGELEAGAATAPLEFFGKVVVDAGARPPFRIGELRGSLYAPGEDPDLVSMRPFEGGYVTANHAGGELLATAWDSPEKRAKIAALERAAATPGAPRIVQAMP
jgi:hypothetical protein